MSSQLLDSTSISNMQYPVVGVIYQSLHAVLLYPALADLFCVFFLFLIGQEAV